MARPLRIEFPGAFYHITARGIDRRSIFLDDSDRIFFLETISLIVDRYSCKVHSYCLMNNHYHLLVETPKGNLSKLMMQLNSIYAQYFNIKNKRIGPLFQGRFRSILIERDRYLLELSRYIILNPVRAGIVKKPGEWRWSNYLSIIGETKKPGFLTTDWTLSQFSKEKKKAIESYKNFVNSGINSKFPKEELVGQLILGSERFIRKIRSYVSSKSGKDFSEFPRSQKISIEPVLDEIFQKEMKSGKSRDEIIYSVYHETNYSQKEIADYLNLHYTTISRIIKRYEKSKKR